MSDKESTEQGESHLVPIQQEDVSPIDVFFNMQQALMEGDVERMAILATSAEIELFPDTDPSEKKVYDVTFHVAGSEPLSPALFLSPNQEVRIKQYERALRNAEKFQVKLFQQERWLLPLYNNEGYPLVDDNGEEISLPITQEMVDACTDIADHMADNFRQHPALAQAAEQVRLRLEVEREIKARARREQAEAEAIERAKEEQRKAESAAKEIAEFNNLFDRSNEIL